MVLLQICQDNYVDKKVCGKSILKLHIILLTRICDLFDVAQIRTEKLQGIR